MSRRHRARELLLPAVVASVACTSVIGLPDLPELSQGAGGTAGSSGGRGSTMGGAMAVANASGAGGRAGNASSAGTPSTGGTDSGSGGTSAEGGTAGESSVGGGAGDGTGGTVGGTGGDGTGGTVGGTGGAGNGGGGTGGGNAGGGGTGTTCTPSCAAPSEVCRNGACECAAGYTPCDDACVDLDNDVLNCGQCGSDCSSDGCSAGRCYTQLVTITDNGTRIAVDADYVYYSLQDAGTVRKVLRTSKSDTLVASLQDNPYDIAVYGDDIYWVNLKETYQGTVMTRPKSGTTADVQELVGGEDYPTSIAVVSSGIYWLNEGLPGSIVRTSFDGTMTTVLAADSTMANTYGLAVDASGVYWSTQGSLPNVNGAIQTTGSSMSATTLLDAAHPMYDLEVFEDALYFIQGTVGIRKIAIDGGNFNTISSNQTMQLTADGTGVYAVQEYEGVNTVVRITLDGVTTTRLATDSAYPLDIAVDDTYVYWASTKGIRYTEKM